MDKIKVYTDEDMALTVSKALRLRGFIACTTFEEGKSSNMDEEQLEYATSIGATLLTHNVQDFPRLHYEFMRQGKKHCGVIIAKQSPVGEIVKSFLRLAASLSAEDMKDRLEYISNW